MKIFSLAVERPEMYKNLMGVVERMFDTDMTASCGSTICTKFKVKFLNKNVQLYSPTTKRKIENGIGEVSKTFNDVDDVIGFKHPFEWKETKEFYTPEFVGDLRYDVIQKVHIMFLKTENEGVIIPIVDVKWEDVVMFSDESKVIFLTVSRQKDSPSDLELVWDC